MNKTERERLRQDCSNFIGSQSYYYPSEAKDMIALLDHIDALEGQIKAAYREGFNHGITPGIDKTYFDACWSESDAEAAIAAASEV